MKKVILFTLIVLTLFFRASDIVGKLVFDWDQNRDVSEVTKMLRTHKPALLGPIVKGEAGGFYLGPLYYYILAPVVGITKGNPEALAVISLGADVALVCALYLYLSSRTHKKVAFAVAAMWATSPLIIRMAMVPWNVSFVPLWTLAFISAIEKKKVVWLALLVTLTTSIHVSLWPIAAVGAGICLWQLRQEKIRIWIYAALAALVPLLPLIVHDLTHSYENLHLFKFFLSQGSHGAATYKNMVFTVLEKFGYTVGRIATGEPVTWLGLCITAASILHSIIVRKNKDLVHLMIIFVILGSLVYYRNTDFAEYYLVATFVPLFLLIAYLLQSLSRRLPLLTSIGLVILVISLLGGGWKERQKPGSPYSLAVKKQVVSAIKELGYPVEVRRTLPRERDTGFPYLMKSASFVSDAAAARKVYIYESKNMEITSPPEARSIIYEKSIDAFKIVVFSN